MYISENIIMSFLYYYSRKKDLLAVLSVT